MARTLTSAGAGKNDFIQIAYGYGLFTGGLGVHYGGEKIGASVIPISGGNTRRQLQLMEDFGSTVLACTPSYAAYLAEAIEESGIKREDLKLRIGVFGAEPWTENLQTLLNLPSHILRPRFCPKNADAQFQVLPLNTTFLNRLSQVRSIRRRTSQYRTAKILHQLQLSPGVTARNRNNRSTNLFAPIMYAQTTGKQTIAIGNLNKIIFAGTRRSQRARHHLRPNADIGSGIAHHRRFSGGTRRSMHPNDLTHGHRKQTKRIIVAQILLHRKRQLAQIVYRLYMFGPQALTLHLLPIVRHIIVHTLHRITQTLTLYLTHILPRHRFKMRVPNLIGHYIHFRLKAKDLKTYTNHWN